MTDDQNKSSPREMSTTEGVRTGGGTSRNHHQHSSADLNVGTPSVVGEPGYQGTYGETTKPASEASSIKGTSRGETARDVVVPDVDRLIEPVYAHRGIDAATEPSLRSIACASGSKAGRLQGPRVIDCNAGTCIPPPEENNPASPAESGQGGTRGRSSRSSQRPVTPATRPRGTDVVSSLPKKEPLMDVSEQEDKTWLLNIQRKLYTWSRNHPEEAWGNMWGWLISPQSLRLAWQRVAGNRGARCAGVDKVTVRYIKERIGVERFLGELGQSLKSGLYRPSPVRRVMIPKSGKPGKLRPLGVPTVRDRVVQAALLQLLEPVFEAEFYTVSYGFRPKRSVRDCVEHIRLAIKPPRERNQPRRLSPPYQWVIEGDIKACFDNIDHHVLMQRIRRRIGDLKVSRLVGAFLKADVLAEGGFIRTTAGTPQGGILSPLLANVVLSTIEARYERYLAPGLRRDGKPYERPFDQIRKFRHRERRAGRPVFVPIRYADDFVVLISGSEQQARDEKEALTAYLGTELKLTLSAEKTHVTALTEGFEFLGHHIRLNWDDRWGYWPRVEIPKHKVRDFYYNIKQLTKGQTHRSFQAVIDEINPVLRGWGNFYKHCYYAKGVFARADHYVWDRLRRWLRKKYPKTPRLEVRRRYWRRIGERSRLRWVDVRPVAIVADIPVGRHDLLSMESPGYTWTTSESLVHNERCTPGSGAGDGESTGGNLGGGALSPRSL